MLAKQQPRRALVVADPVPVPLTDLFGAACLPDWEAVPADGLLAARFALQHQPCDVLLVDAPVYLRDGADAFAWLAHRHQVPVVLLRGADLGDVPAPAGESVTVPRTLAGVEPDLLAAALEQALRLAELSACRRRSDEALLHSRRQVDRLVGLLWRSLPHDADRRWFSQRHALERLREEIIRSRRYGQPLTVVLGEVQAAPAGELPDWVVERILAAKRGCDVAGQYGPHGFILLLTNTTAAGGRACCRRLQRTLGQAGAGTTSPLAVVDFGLASLPEDGSGPEHLLCRAEQNLESARASQPAAAV